MAEVRWKDEPEEHDYPAAGSYLSLLASAPVVDELVERLRARVCASYHTDENTDIPCRIVARPPPP